MGDFRLQQHLAHGLGERAVEGAATGTFVAAATKAFSHLSHIQLAFAAQAYAIASVGQLAEKCGNFDTPD